MRARREHHSIIIVIISYYSHIALSAWPHQPRALDENLKLGERMFKTLYNLSLTKLDDLYIELNTKFA